MEVVSYDATNNNSCSSEQQQQQSSSSVDVPRDLNDKDLVIVGEQREEDGDDQFVAPDSTTTNNIENQAPFASDAERKAKNLQSLRQSDALDLAEEASHDFKPPLNTNCDSAAGSVDSSGQIPEIKATIVGYEYQKSFMNNYAVYQIITATECVLFGSAGEYKVERRYSDFLNLYLQLSAQYQDSVVPIPPPKSFDMFRGKSCIEEDRMKWLQVFLDLLILNPDLCSVHEVVRFLTDHEPMSKSLKSNAKKLLTNKFIKFTEKIQSARYGDSESDEFYLNLKSQISKLNESIQWASQLNSKQVYPNLHKELLEISNSILDMHTSLKTNEAYSADSEAFSQLGKLIKIFQCTAGQIKVEETKESRPKLETTDINCHSQIFDTFIVHLGACQIIINTFQLAFSNRDKKFRPIIDLDSHFKEIHLTAKSNSKQIDNLENQISFGSNDEKQSELQIHRLNFKAYSDNQKKILQRFYNYLTQYLKCTVKQYLVSLVGLEKQYLAQLYEIHES
ncbi:MAG: Sorting nexin-1 [Marteilia pararefringens]